MELSDFKLGMSVAVEIQQSTTSTTKIPLILEAVGLENARGVFWVQGWRPPHWGNEMYYLSNISQLQPGNAQIVKDFAANPPILQLNPVRILGCDPEMFFVDKTARTLVPAFGLLPCKSEAPKELGSKDSSSGHRYYYDGFGGEWCPPPQGCIAYLTDAIQRSMLETIQAAQKRGEVIPTLKNTFRIPKSLRQTLPEEYVDLGCEPSYNAYDEPDVLHSRLARDIPYRSAGGHIHFTAPKVKLEADAKPLVKYLDATLGIAGVTLAGEYDTFIRRRYYGRAGEYRLPQHGLEYRVLSNFWLASPGITHLVFEIARSALKLAEVGWLPISEPEELIRHIINTCDVTGAREYITRNSSIFEKLFSIAFKGSMRSTRTDDHRILGRRVALETLKSKSISDILINPNDILRNWHISNGWSTHSEHVGASWVSLAYEIEAKRLT